MDNLNSAVSYFAKKLAIFDDATVTEQNTELVKQLIQIIGDNPQLIILETLLDFYKEARNRIVRSDLPLALAEAGLSQAHTDDGIDVSIETVYETKQIDKAQVANWLETRGYGDIIKDTLLLPKGAYTPEVEKALEELHVDYTRDSTINGMQLKSVVKKHLEAGGEVPPVTAMSVSVFTQAKIKAPKITM